METVSKDSSPEAILHHFKEYVHSSIGQAYDKRVTDVELAVALAVSHAKEANKVRTDLSILALEAAQRAFMEVKPRIDTGEIELFPNCAQVDEQYVPCEPTSALIGWHIETLTHCIVSGPSGSSKTYAIEQEAAKRGLTIMKLSCSDGIDYRNLVIRQSAKQGETYFRYGALVLAARAGAILLLDEVDHFDDECSAVVMAMTEQRNPMMFLPETGERVVPKTGFMVFVTSNRLRDEQGGYGGRIMSRALANRFGGVAADYLPVAEEVKIICKAVPAANPLEVAKIVEGLHRLRTLYLAGALGAAPSVRTGISVARYFYGIKFSGENGARPMHLHTAWECAILSKLPPAEYQAASAALGVKKGG